MTHVAVTLGVVEVEMNAALREKAGMARVCLGGAASGTVRANPDSYLLSAGSFGRQETYASASVTLAGRRIRTWVLAGHSPEEHVNAFLSWLMSGHADVLEKVADPG